MPSADYRTWTPCDELAKRVADWTQDHAKLQSGDLYRVITEAEGKTTLSRV